MTLQSTPIELTGFYRVKTTSVTLPGQYNIFNEFIGIKVNQYRIDQDTSSTVED